MSAEDYKDGTAAALENFGLVKTAFLGAAVRAIGSRVAGPAAHGVAKTLQPALTAGKKYISEPIGKAVGAVGNKINAAGTSIENAGVRGAERILGPSGGQVAGTILKNAPAEAMRQGAAGAAIGGALQGGMDAAFAEDGQRGDAFLRGAGMGAASGAAFGVLGGALGQATKNVRRSNLEQTFQRKGVNPHTPAGQQQVDARLNRGFFSNLTDIGTSQGKGSVANLGGQAAQFGAEWIAPAMILPASLGGGIPFISGTEEQPQQPQQKIGEDFTGAPTANFSDPILAASLAGSGIGAGTVGTIADVLAHKGHWPKGTFGMAAKRYAPIIGGVPGALTGRYIARQFWPSVPTVTPEVEKLKEIDFDKLMRYYQKREE